jgi:hypothetical protein
MTVQEKVLEYLKAHPGARLRECVAGTQASRDGVGSALVAMTRYGQVIRKRLKEPPHQFTGIWTYYAVEGAPPPVLRKRRARNNGATVKDLERRGLLPS